MSTRSHIAIEDTDGTVRSVYCQHDGSLDWVGKILLNHYTNVADINALLDMGKISELRATIGEKHVFNERVPFGQLKTADQKGWTTFYGRDGCRPDDIDTRTCKNLDAWKNFVRSVGLDYFYVFTTDGSWMFAKDDIVGDTVNLKPLTLKDCEK